MSEMKWRSGAARSRSISQENVEESRRRSDESNSSIGDKFMIGGSRKGDRVMLGSKRGMRGGCDVAQSAFSSKTKAGTMSFSAIGLGETKDNDDMEPDDELAKAINKLLDSDWDVELRKKFNIDSNVSIPFKLKEKCYPIFNDPKEKVSDCWSDAINKYGPLMKALGRSPIDEKIIAINKGGNRNKIFKYVLELEELRTKEDKIDWSKIHDAMMSVCDSYANRHQDDEADEKGGSNKTSPAGRANRGRSIVVALCKLVPQLTYSEHDMSEYIIKWLAHAMRPIIAHCAGIVEVVHYVRVQEADIKMLIYDYEKTNKKSVKDNGDKDNSKNDDSWVDDMQKRMEGYSLGVVNSKALQDTKETVDESVRGDVENEKDKKDGENDAPTIETYPSFTLRKIQELRQDPEPVSRYHSMYKAAMKKSTAKLHYVMDPLLPHLRREAFRISKSKVSNWVIYLWNVIYGRIEAMEKKQKVQDLELLSKPSADLIASRSKISYDSHMVALLHPLMCGKLEIFDYLDVLDDLILLLTAEGFDAEPVRKWQKVCRALQVNGPAKCSAHILANTILQDIRELDRHILTEGEIADIQRGMALLPRHCSDFRGCLDLHCEEAKKAWKEGKQQQGVANHGSSSMLTDDSLRSFQRVANFIGNGNDMNGFNASKVNFASVELQTPTTGLKRGVPIFNKIPAEPKIPPEVKKKKVAGNNPFDKNDDTKAGGGEDPLQAFLGEMANSYDGMEAFEGSFDGSAGWMIDVRDLVQSKKSDENAHVKVDNKSSAVSVGQKTVTVGSRRKQNASSSAANVHLSGTFGLRVTPTKDRDDAAGSDGDQSFDGIEDADMYAENALAKEDDGYETVHERIFGGQRDYKEWEMIEDLCWAAEDVIPAFEDLWQIISEQRNATRKPDVKKKKSLASAPVILPLPFAKLKALTAAAECLKALSSVEVPERSLAEERNKTTMTQYRVSGVFAAFWSKLARTSTQVSKMCGEDEQLGDCKRDVFGYCKKVEIACQKIFRHVAPRKEQALAEVTNYVKRRDVTLEQVKAYHKANWVQEFGHLKDLQPECFNELNRMIQEREAHVNFERAADGDDSEGSG